MKRSKVSQLPPELRAEIERLIIEQTMTYAQIADHLRNVGGDVSKSSLHRYAQSREKANERIRLAREMTAALGKDLKSLPEEDHDRAASELIMATLVQAATNMAQLDEPSTEEVLDASVALDKLAGAKKKNVETFALRRKLREQMAVEANAAVDRAVTERGLSADIAESIKADILGVARKTAA